MDITMIEADVSVPLLQELPTFHRTWTIGRCHGPPKYRDQDQRCCLNPGEHTLICENEFHPIGWGKESVKIQGQEYCNDFVGFKAMRSVLISGKRLYFDRH